MIAPPHRETEIKLRIGDLGALIGDLRRLGARCLGRVFERNTLFDTPGAGLRGRGCLLRLRMEAPSRSSPIPAGRAGAWLTFKAPVGRRGGFRYKEKLESECRIGPGGHWTATFRALGFRAGFRYEKFRTGFRLGELDLDLDETPVGVFLELEGRPPAIERAARSLGFSPRDYIRGTYWDLYAADCRRRGKIPRNMLFGR